MVKLVNYPVSRDLYKILNYRNFWVQGNYKNEWGLCFVVDDKTKLYYPYPNKELAEQDYKQISRIKKLLCKQ